MQDRFHALLKRRLQVEIEQNPPLFPWESEICEYDAEESDYLRTNIVSSQFWVRQIQRRMPVAMSEQLLGTLMHRCQRLTLGSAQIGRQLVEAVEPLFPGQSDTLNHLAGLVLASAPRAATLIPEADPKTVQEQGFPSNYDDATQTQKMALSLLAVREMLALLTLSVSADQPRVERQWMTDSGPLTLLASYQSGLQTQLCVNVTLPCSGRAELQCGDRHAQAQRSTSGMLSVDLFDLVAGDVCTLDVYLSGDVQPLTFSLQIA
ncbi:MAG: PatU [Elainellaceae cyanobacterium]